MAAGVDLTNSGTTLVFGRWGESILDLDTQYKSQYKQIQMRGIPKNYDYQRKTYDVDSILSTVMYMSRYCRYKCYVFRLVFKRMGRYDKFYNCDLLCLIFA